MNSLLKITGLILLIAVGCQSAMAISTIRFSTDGSTWTTVADSNGLDVNPDSNIVAVAALAVDTFTVDIAAGKTASFDPAHLDTVSLISGSGTLWIQYSDMFPAQSGGAILNIGGTTSGTVAYNAYSGSALFDTASLLGSTGSLGGPAFAASLSGSGVEEDANFYLTQEIIITQESGLTSFDAELKVPDSGASALLLGLGLAGLVAAARRSKQ